MVGRLGFLSLLSSKGFSQGPIDKVVPRVQRSTLIIILFKSSFHRSTADTKHLPLTE